MSANRVTLPAATQPFIRLFNWDEIVLFSIIASGFAMTYSLSAS
jgi:hypothetical protein